MEGGITICCNREIVYWSGDALECGLEVYFGGEIGMDYIGEGLGVSGHFANGTG